MTTHTAPASHDHPVGKSSMNQDNGNDPCSRLDNKHPWDRLWEPAARHYQPLEHPELGPPSTGS